MLRVESSQLSYDAESGRLLHQGEPFTGIVYSTWPNGQPEAESELRDGLNCGRSRSWYSTGTPLGDAEMAFGVLHGRAREWHPDGRLARDGEYEYGIVIWERSWSPDGEQKTDYLLKPTDHGYKSLQQRRRAYGDQ